MPIIKVWGLSAQNREVLPELRKTLARTIASVKELGLKKRDSTILFPADVLAMSPDEFGDVIVEISGLFYKPERTPAIIDSLVESVGKQVSDIFPWAKVECLVYQFDETTGFWSSDH